LYQKLPEKDIEYNFLYSLTDLNPANGCFSCKNILNFVKTLALIQILAIIMKYIRRRSLTMNKEELVQEVAKKANVTQKEASEVINAWVETVQKTVAKGKKVTLVGFGTFEARKRAARTGRNPQTGKEIKIPAKTVPAFSAGKKFKTVVNGK